MVLTFRTKFNGFYSDQIFELNDKPIMIDYMRIQVKLNTWSLNEQKK